MELREKIAAELSRGWVAIPSEPGRIADRILSIPEIAEALRELELRKRVEERLAGTMDERPFIDGNPLGKPNA